MMSDATVIISTESRTGTQTPLGLPRPVIVVAWLALTVFVCIVFAAGLPLSWTLRLTSFCGPNSVASIGWTREGCATFFVVVDILYFGFFLALSIFLFWRKPGERMATFTALALLLFGAASPTPIIQLMQSSESASHIGMIVFLGGMAALILFFNTFPDGRYVPKWTRPFSWVMLAVFALWVIFPAINPMLIWPWNSSIAVILGLFAVSAIAQIIRYQRHSTAAQRQQTKIVIFGSSCALLFYASLIATETVLSETGILTNWALPSRVTLIYFIVVLRYVALLLIPISLTIALLRYRLWEIDLMISRTLTGTLVTGGLVVVFVGAVLAVQQAARMVTGGEQSGLAVALASVAVAITFNPLRQRLTHFIDKRFYPKYLEKVYRKETKEAQQLATPSSLNSRQFGVYEVQELIGRGGMAEVYRGRHTQLDRPVAIKVLPSNLADNEAFRLRFEREAQTVARLRHPNIVQLYDFGVQDQTYYMVMEYLAGQTLAQRIQAGTPIPLDETMPILSGLAEALDYAHQQGVVHRDIKPSNIILQPITAAAPGLPTVRPILMDFGIARILESSSGLTSTGTLGTLDYIAPEQILSSAAADGRADIYALGVVAYQMLAGQLPFTGGNAGALVLAHLQKPPTDPRKLNPALSESVSRAILRALAKEPAERFSSAGSFINAMSNQPIMQSA